MQVQGGQLLKNQAIATSHMHLSQRILFVITVIYYMVGVQYRRLLAKTYLNQQMFMQFMRCVLKRFGYKKHSLKCGQLTKKHICWHRHLVHFICRTHFNKNFINNLLSTTMLSDMQVIMMGKCHSHHFKYTISLSFIDT